MPAKNEEGIRLEEALEGKTPWKKWGPYLSERQWGTVREDYSEGGDAWDYFTHDQARSRAYRWGEDKRGRVRRQPPDRLDRARGQNYSAFRDHGPQAGFRDG
jgi:hypothetical protein